MSTAANREKDMHHTIALALDFRQIFAKKARAPHKSFASVERRGYPLPPSPFAHSPGHPILRNSPQIRKIRSICDFRHVFVYPASIFPTRGYDPRPAPGT